jgi:hypothetical protein
MKTDQAMGWIKSELQPPRDRVASLDNLAAPSFSKMRTGIAMMIDPKAKLIDILGNAQEYLDLATYRSRRAGAL